MRFKKLAFVLFIVCAALSPQGNFQAQTEDTYFVVSIHKTGNGSGLVTSSPPGIDCGDGFNNCSQVFKRGTPVTLSARALHGPSQFNGWSIVVGSTLPCAASGSDCTFIVTENSSANAEFVLD